MIKKNRLTSKMIEIHEDQSGAGSFEVLIGVILLMFIFLMTSPNVTMIWKAWRIENVKVRVVEQMSIKGGLTSDLETAAIERLKKIGFKESEIRISGTRGPKGWGTDLGLLIECDDTMTHYQRSGLIGIKKVVENITYRKEGFGVSFYENNND